MLRNSLVSVTVLLSSLSLSGCGVPEGPPVEQPSSPAEARADGLYGKIDDFEFAIDAPWRLEPEQNCNLKFGCTTRYDAIPLSVIFRDAYQSPWYRVQSVTVDEVGSTFAPVTIPLSSFHELERTAGNWSQNQSLTYVGPPHAICRRWRGDNCAGFEDLLGTSEWDGTLFYSLRQLAVPGTTVRLKVTANVVNIIGQAGQLSNTVLVRLGNPLPRFDDRWVYGDIHYHSQGTDNEGESGYSHRTTLQAMSALGLDFTFATEHASNSGQFNDYEDVTPFGSRILRDMSQRRWASLLHGLNDFGGANAEVASKPRLRTSTRLAAPQLFLGGEVDVIPEIGVEDYGMSRVTFGNHKAYYWLEACVKYPGFSELQSLGIDSWFGCPTLDRPDLSTPAYDTESFVGVTGRWFLKDLQGPGDRLFARQHLLHLPTDPENELAFVPSNTTVWGGASRRLATLLRQEYTQGQKGVAFLAHPVDYASGAGPDRLGPDIIPYSAEQLDDAFRNRSVLGLQVWNEDVRLRADRTDATNLAPTDTWGNWSSINSGPQFAAIHNGLATFDRMLLWSVDSRRTQNVAGLAPGQPRKVFLAGGSDAHGDLNYARKGYAFGLKSVSDLAMGKPRNLVMVPTRTGRQLTSGAVTTQALAQRDVTTGLASGQFVVTDGPVVRIAIDVNGNGIIDDADVPMGGESSWSWLSPELRVVVEWKSTPEFGRLTLIDLTVNAFTNSTGLGMTYQPTQAGVRGPNQPIGWFKNTYAAPGVTFYELDDHSFWDPSGQLRIGVPNSEGYGGRRVLTLNPQRFKTARTWMGSVPCMGCDNPTSVSQKQNGEPLPDLGTCENTCPSQGASDVMPPTHLIIRAVGKTNGLGDISPATGRPACDVLKGECEPRVVLTNPVWARYEEMGFSL